MCIHARSKLFLPGAAAVLAVLAAVALLTPGARADEGELPSSVKFEQWETQPQGAWITGALQANNSDYYEGEVVPFRLVIPERIEPGTYVFSICRNYDDDDRRGYLFLDDFDTSRDADPEGTIGSSDPPIEAINATIDDVFEVGGRGDCKAGDRETIVTITKAAGDAYVLWGGHLASPLDDGVGAGNGAASWPGASLHMKILAPSKDLPIQTCSSAATPTGTPQTPTATSTGTPHTPTPTTTGTPAPPTNTPQPSNTPHDRKTPKPRTATPEPEDTATVAPAVATPTRVLGVLPALLPAAGTCGSEDDGTATWIFVLGAVAIAALAAAGIGAGIAMRRPGAA